MLIPGKEIYKKYFKNNTKIRYKIKKPYEIKYINEIQNGCMNWKIVDILLRHLIIFCN